MGKTEWEGRHVAVTGGAEGIGYAIARAFAGWGLKPVLIDIQAEKAESAAATLKADGIDARAEAADVSDRASIVACADRLADAGIVPAMLWINAGVGAAAGILKAPPAAAEWVYGVNALGVIWTAQAFIPRMLDGPRPAHVGVTASSAAYASPKPPFPMYAASKHATYALGEAIAADLEGTGIGTTIFCPGLLNTAIWDGAKARPERFGGTRHAPHEAGAYWRAAQSPEITMPHLLEVVAAGGGTCAAFTDKANLALFDERTAAMRAAIRVHQP